MTNPNTKKELDKIKDLLRCRGLTDLELINRAALGKLAWIYTEGDAIKKDYLDNRVNFVTDKISGLIKEIYFG